MLSSNPFSMCRMLLQVNFQEEFNSQFSFSYSGCQNKVKGFSIPHYLSMAGGRIIE